jgi:hypothetical protein
MHHSLLASHTVCLLLIFLGNYKQNKKSYFISHLKKELDSNTQLSKRLVLAFKKLFFTPKSVYCVGN